MTNYRVLISDLPERTEKILRECSPRAEALDMEVTLLLCISMASIIVPYERMGKRNADTHPSHDSKRHEKERRHFVELLDRKFLGSILWESLLPGSWCYGEGGEPENDAGRWAEKSTPIDGEMTVDDIIYNLRNALAHGNIYTGGEPKIHSLIFLFRVCNLDNNNCKKYRWDFIKVSPEDYGKFLDAWNKFCKDREYRQIVDEIDDEEQLVVRVRIG